MSKNTWTKAKNNTTKISSCEVIDGPIIKYPEYQRGRQIKYFIDNARKMIFLKMVDTYFSAPHRFDTIQVQVDFDISYGIYSQKTRNNTNNISRMIRYALINKLYESSKDIEGLLNIPNQEIFKQIVDDMNKRKIFSDENNDDQDEQKDENNALGGWRFNMEQEIQVEEYEEISVDMGWVGLDTLDYYTNVKKQFYFSLQINGLDEDNLVTKWIPTACKDGYDIKILKNRLVSNLSAALDYICLNEWSLDFENEYDYGYIEKKQMMIEEINKIFHILNSENVHDCTTVIMTKPRSTGILKEYKSILTLTKATTNEIDEEEQYCNLNSTNPFAIKYIPGSIMNIEGINFITSERYCGTLEDVKDMLNKMPKNRASFKIKVEFVLLLLGQLAVGCDIDCRKYKTVHVDLKLSNIMYKNSQKIVKVNIFYFHQIHIVIVDYGDKYMGNTLYKTMSTYHGTQGWEPPRNIVRPSPVSHAPYVVAKAMVLLLLGETIEENKLNKIILECYKNKYVNKNAKIDRLEQFFGFNKYGNFNILYEFLCGVWNSNQSMEVTDLIQHDIFYTFNTMQCIMKEYLNVNENNARNTNDATIKIISMQLGWI